MSQFLLRQETADRLGIHWAKLDKLRREGHIPEAVQVGNYWCFPADQLAAIRARLVEQKKIKQPALTAA